VLHCRQALGSYRTVIQLKLKKREYLDSDLCISGPASRLMHRTLLVRVASKLMQAKATDDSINSGILTAYSHWKGSQLSSAYLVRRGEKESP
jgi:hypothetical protein